jgi:hypothetical protein
VAGAGVNSPVAAVGRAEGAAHRHALQAGRRLALAAGIVASHEPPAPPPLRSERFGVVRELHANECTAAAKPSLGRRTVRMEAP